MKIHNIELPLVRCKMATKYDVINSGKEKGQSGKRLNSTNMKKFKKDRRHQKAAEQVSFMSRSTTRMKETI